MLSWGRFNFNIPATSRGAAWLHAGMAESNHRQFLVQQLRHRALADAFADGFGDQAIAGHQRGMAHVGGGEQLHTQRL